MINNKKTFEIYLILRLTIIITLTIVTATLATTLLLKINLYHTITTYVGNYTLLILTWTSCLLILIDNKIKPGFIDLQIIEDQIIIRTYNPNLKKWESPFVLLGYKKRIMELLVSREEYNDYKLQFGIFGLKKELKLQKISNNGVYESASINISLLGQRKYTNLILAIDRQRAKICLN